MNAGPLVSDREGVSLSEDDTVFKWPLVLGMTGECSAGSRAETLSAITKFLLSPRFMTGEDLRKGASSLAGERLLGGLGTFEGRFRTLIILGS